MAQKKKKNYREPKVTRFRAAQSRTRKIGIQNPRHNVEEREARETVANQAGVQHLGAQIPGIDGNKYKIQGHTEKTWQSIHVPPEPVVDTWHFVLKAWEAPFFELPIFAQGSREPRFPFALMVAKQRAILQDEKFEVVPIVFQPRLKALERVLGNLVRVVQQVVNDIMDAERIKGLV